MRLKFSVVFLAVAAFFLSFSISHAQQDINTSDETIEATVTKVLKQEIIHEDGDHLDQKLEMEVTNGSIVGRTIVVENGNVPVSNPIIYKVGDRLVLDYSKDVSGGEFFQITDYVRRPALYILLAIFVILTILISKIRGVTSLFGMIVSFVVIFKLVLPQILAGHDPVLVSIFGAAIIVPVTFYLAHGLTNKTHVAIVSTFITLILVGLLSGAFIEIGKLSGFTSDEASYVESNVGGTINMKGILLAGIIISSLGILNDITISQASVVSELKHANPKLKFWGLFTHAMRVGHDHIASLVNTLILVYAGASLPLLLLFNSSSQSFLSIINLEIVAEEIIKTLVGSIGLVLAVPITTAFASFVYQNIKGVKSEHNH